MINTCLFCNNTIELNNNDTKEGMLKISCKLCGDYYISKKINPRDLNPKQLNMMFHLVTTNTRDTKIAFISDENIQDEKLTCFCVDKLENLYPKNLSNRIDCILLNIFAQTKEFGVYMKIEFHSDNWGTYRYNRLNKIFMMDIKGYSQDICNGVIQALIDMNYIMYSDISLQRAILLSGKSLERIEELHKKPNNIKQAFVAMWFDESMQKARECIEKAIYDSGYVPMIIDVKEHNNQIVPEIFYEIKHSKFMIADLTGSRGGVYYEAGYAEALEKQVILTCRKGESTHFDVKQKNTIFWEESNYDSLYEKLKRRIEVTIN